MAALYYKRGYLMLDKRWIFENEFFKSLSHAEFRIMIYLLASIMKAKKRDSAYKRGEKIALLYQINNLLVTNVSTRTIANRCHASRGTVCRAVEIFDEIGAVIRIPEGDDPGENNIYIMGFTVMLGDKEGRTDFLFVDSIPVRSGKKIPPEIKANIREKYAEIGFQPDMKGWKLLFGDGGVAQ